MDDPLVEGFDLSRFGSLVDGILDGSLDGVFLCTDLPELVSTDAVFEIGRLSFINKIISDRVVHPVLEVDIKLVFEGVPPMLVVSQMLYRFLEISAQKVLGNVETLELLHCLDLLHPPLPSIFQSLVLLLDPFNFAFHLLLPVSIFELATFCILIFELSNFFHLMLLFDFLRGLLYRFIEQYVKNGLHLNVVVKEIIVLDLSDLVNAGLLGDVFWSRWFRLENVSLNLNFRFIGLGLTLFS